MDVDPPPPRVTFVDREGDSLTVGATIGWSVMEVAKCHGIPGIRADCGGFMSCGTCHVYVDEADLDRLAPISPMEETILSGVAAERRPNSRLSCQLPVGALCDLRVTLPDRQL